MSNYVYDQVAKLVRRFHTRDPFELLEAMHVVIRESDQFQSLKGFCFLSCRTTYVVINDRLSASEKRIVAAHELGHILLHKNQLKLAPMKDSRLYDMTSRTEYEANLFAADLLIPDEELQQISDHEDLDYFALCSLLDTSPDLMSFKLFSLLKRGCSVNMPLSLRSNFLADPSAASDSCQTDAADAGV